MATAPTKPAPDASAAPTVSAPAVLGAWAVIGHAIAQRIAEPPRARAVRDTSLLDFILVVGALVLVAGGLYGLFTIKDIPDKTLPIIASILSFVCGSILGAYAGYRWGASQAMKHQAAPQASPSK